MSNQDVEEKMGDRHFKSGSKRGFEEGFEGRESVQKEVKETMDIRYWEGFVHGYAIGRNKWRQNQDILLPE